MKQESLEMFLKCCLTTTITNVNWQYSSKVIGTLAVDGGLFHLVHRGGAWAGCESAPVPSLYQM